MMTFADLVFFVAGISFALPCLILAAECLAGRRPHRPRLVEDLPPRSFRLAVVVPAHDEAGLIGPTVSHLREYLMAADRLLVVADNCSDATAVEAERAGAQVLIRTDPHRRGKGFALEFALARLSHDPPEAIVFFDADCRIAQGSIDALASRALATQRPVQADYLIKAPTRGGSMATVSGLALIVINRVRPLGLWRMGFPCQLTGTGMAMPWDLATAMRPTGSNLVEDLAMGIDLALQGHPPLYCPDVEVVSTLPTAVDAALGQRKRWEHGRLLAMGKTVLPLLWAGVRKRHADLLMMGLDLTIPPLALLVLLEVIVFAVLGLRALAGGPWLPVLILGSSGALATFALSAAIRCHVPTLSPWMLFTAVPKYVARKLSIYVSFLFRRQSTWERTERDTPPPEASKDG